MKQNTHKTTLLCIKKARVDKAIVPVVNWLNGFDSVFTRWCCQKTILKQAYIIFHCDYENDLAIICRMTNGFGRVEVQEFQNGLRYCLYFDLAKKDNLNLFVNALKTYAKKTQKT